MRILDPILRAGEGRALRQLENIAAQVSSIETDIAALTDEQLRAETTTFKERLAAGETVDDILPEAFAVVREASHRVLGMRHFDVQVMGGAALHLGNIAEMRTGEGKTLVATLPAYLNALTGQGVHVVTVNDYLAARDAAHMGQVHTFLGLSVGVITSDLTHAQRRDAYACDITYGTNNELGFDYLRDNMATHTGELVQRGHHFAIIDEADSILIDEARTPLIISGPGPDTSSWAAALADLATRMIRGVHYDVDEKKRTISLTEAGVALAEDEVGTDHLYTADHTALVGQLNQALRAHALYHRDVDYVVAGTEVLLVDEHTGRTLPGRRYSDGLHQALEAKEHLPVQPESQTLATITLQNYFRLYDRISGMTGTAEAEAPELRRTYDLGVIPIPTNRPNRRVDHPDVVFRNEAVKHAAVLADIKQRHATGQPILVGTASVESSEKVSALLTDAGITHEVLNAKQHEREAHVIAQAGRLGAVTVATNMAGRGTDIILGGNADEHAHATLTAAGLTQDDPDTAEEWAQAWPAALEDAKKAVADERAKVHAAGGLYVLATERHESRRIDNQLRGRAGRQGDPGETRFYLSLEDDIVRRFSGSLLTRAMDALGAADMPIESTLVNKAVASAQGAVETQNAETRRNVLKYDDVLSAQREVIYAERLRVVRREGLDGQVRAMIAPLVARTVTSRPGSPWDWDLKQVLADVHQYVPTGVTTDGLRDEVGDAPAPADIVNVLTAAAEAAYDTRSADLGADRLADVEQQVTLAVVDRAWRNHLYTMDYLQEGIHMRAHAQRDPVVEYQREAHELFLRMLEDIQADIVGYVFGLPVPTLAELEARQAAEHADDDNIDEDVDEIVNGFEDELADEHA